MDISVIVPLYNGQKYVRRIIDMISNMTCIQVKYRCEIIFVNDYPQIPIILNCDTNMQIKTIENTKNMGIHASRIEGLKQAKGKCVLFLDQDDTLNKLYFESQLEHIGNAEAVICNGMWREGEKIFSDSNKMKISYNFDEYLQDGYPLVSLGQLLIKKNSIPAEWREKPMKYNGWDDHFLWAILMARGVNIVSNQDLLYIHEEDGRNASFNWEQMIKSGIEFRDKFIKFHFMDALEEKRFGDLVKTKIEKYTYYDKLEKLFEKITFEKLESFFERNEIFQVAIYGMGIYGKRILELLKFTNVKVLFAIDRRLDVKTCDLPLYELGRGNGKVDAVIVTPVSSYEAIKKEIQEAYNCRSISLMELLA